MNSTPAAAPAAAAAAGPGADSAADVSSNPINTAFDDLLGLSDPAPLLGGFSAQAAVAAPTTATAAANVEASSKKGGKRPWLRATIKVSNTIQPAGVDWAGVSMTYRVYPSSKRESGTSASLVVRLDNQSQSPVTDSTLRFKSQEEVRLGTIAPGSCAQSDKIGPFLYTQVDASQDLKGTFLCSGCEVPFKVSLPASAFLNPEDDLSMDQVAQEMTSGDWSSDTVKVDLTLGLPPDDIKQMIGGLLRASEVGNGGMASSPPSASTFAAYSIPTGAKVRAIVKIKDKSAKIDIRCTSAILGKSLAADSKRLLL